MKKYKFLPSTLLIVAWFAIIRIPSFFESWWHGDEAIYMVIGRSMSQGGLLYVDAWDHKPPFLYVIYAVSSFFFGDSILPIRILSLISSVLVTILTIVFARYILKQAFRTVAITGILLSLMWGIMFDASTYNAEHVFVPLLIGSYITLYISQNGFKHFLDSKSKSRLEKLKDSQVQTPLNSKNILLLVVSGLLASLAVITKFHALVELVPVLTTIWLMHISQVVNPTSVHVKKDIVLVFKKALVYTASLALFPLLTILYYWRQQAFDELKYAVWGFNQSVYVSEHYHFAGLRISPTVFFGVLMVILMTLVVYITLIRKNLRPIVIVLVWFAAAMIAVGLSGKPYPHYLLQIVAPLVLLVTYYGEKIATFKRSIFRVRLMLGGYICIVLISFSLGMYMYTERTWHISDVNYINYTYGFGKFVFGQRSLEEFRAGYDAVRYEHVREANEIIQNYTYPEQEVFIVSNLPSIYLVSNRNISVRWVVSSHLAPINHADAYQEAIDAGTQFVLVQKGSGAELPDEKLSELKLLKIQESEHFVAYVPQQID